MDAADVAADHAPRLLMTISVPCPACTSSVRWLDVDRAIYGCPRCTYISTEKRS